MIENSKSNQERSDFRDPLEKSLSYFKDKVRSAFDKISPDQKFKAFPEIREIIYKHRKILYLTLFFASFTRSFAPDTYGNYSHASATEITSSQPEGPIIHGDEDQETHIIMSLITGRDVSYQDFLKFVYPKNRELALRRVLAGSHYLLTESHYKPLLEMLKEGKVQEVDSILAAKPIETIRLDNYGAIVYMALWDMHHYYSSPRISISNIEDPRMMSRAFYTPIAGTSSMAKGEISDSELMIDSYIAELSHHIQFKQETLLNYTKGFKSTIRIALRSLIKLKTPYNSQLEEYDLPGSLEYEAHSIIEQKLWSELALRVVNYNSLERDGGLSKTIYFLDHFVPEGGWQDNINMQLVRQKIIETAQEQHKKHTQGFIANPDDFFIYIYQLYDLMQKPDFFSEKEKEVFTNLLKELQPQIIEAYEVVWFDTEDFYPEQAGTYFLQSLGQSSDFPIISKYYNQPRVRMKISQLQGSHFNAGDALY